MIDTKDLRDPEYRATFLAQCIRDFPFFCKSFFPDRFNLPFSIDHYRIMDKLMSPSKLIAIGAPRGTGKSSIVDFAYPLYNILFRLKSHIMPVSATATLAIQLADDVKNELDTNPVIRSIYPKMKTDSYSKDQWVTYFETKVLPRGAEQQVRGSLFRGNRPDLIIVDDLENDEQVESEDQRKKLKRWFFGSLLQCIHRPADWKIVMVGTILHEDSLLRNILDLQSWDTLLVELFDENLKSRWPEYISDAQVAQLYEMHSASGTLTELFREYRGICIVPSEALFRAENFQYYDRYPKVISEFDFNNDPDVISFVLSDPARTCHDNSCETAIIGASLNVRTRKVYIRKVIHGHMHISDVIKQMVKVAESINARILAPEVSGVDDLFTYPLQVELKSTGKYYTIIELKPLKSKLERASALAVLYRNNLIIHNSIDCHTLEQALLMCPKCKRWDLIDCLGSMVQLLEDYGQYFYSEDYEARVEKAQAYDELQPQTAMQELPNTWRVA